jgi:hypothetical protein
MLPFGRLWYGEPNSVSNAEFFSKAKARTSEQARKAAMTRWQKFKRKKKYGRNKLVPLTKSKFAIVDARDFEQLKSGCQHLRSVKREKILEKSLDIK